MKMNPYQKKLFSVLVIVVGGYILFNLAFLLAALVINASSSILGVAQNEAPPITGKVLYFILIGLISWLVFRSRLNDLSKATYLTMPLMVIIVMTYISIYQLSIWIVGSIEVVIVCAVIFYLYKKKLSWLYFFSVFYVSILALCIAIFRIQI